MEKNLFIKWNLDICFDSIQNIRKCTVVHEGFFECFYSIINYKSFRSLDLNK